jgi:hypothetical protein
MYEVLLDLIWELSSSGSAVTMLLVGFAVGSRMFRPSLGATGYQFFHEDIATGAWSWYHLHIVPEVKNEWSSTSNALCACALYTGTNWPYVGLYFEYLDKFDCIYLRILYPVYEGLSSRTPCHCQEIYVNVLKIALWPRKAVQLTTSLLIYKLFSLSTFSYVPCTRLALLHRAMFLMRNKW